MAVPSSFAPRATGQDEVALERELRPSQLADFAGQEGLVPPLEIMIRAAKGRQEPLEHILLAGSPGLGKTSLAMVLATEMGVPLKVTSGPALERARDLVGILSGLERGSFLFIDEIHRMPRAVEEYLYGAMERFCVEFTLDQGIHARLLKLDVQPFTLVGATTREALLSAPFRSRFGHTLRFDPYSPTALHRILKRNAKRWGLRASDSALRRLADHARGTPRIANRLLRRARDLAEVESAGELQDAQVERTLDLLGINSVGLEKSDLRVLEALARNHGGPLGLKNLAVAVDEAEDTLAEVLEPWLMRCGYIARTPQGRVLLEAGWLTLGLNIPSAQESANSGPS